MNTEIESVCFDCAMRLGKHTFPDVPELVMGYCPQCGGTQALETVLVQGETFSINVVGPGRQQAA